MSAYILSFKYNLFLEISKPGRSGGRYPWGWPQFCRIKLSWTSNQMSTTTRKIPKLRAIQPVSIRAPLRLMHEILQLVGFFIPILPIFSRLHPIPPTYRLNPFPPSGSHVGRLEGIATFLFRTTPVCNRRGYLESIRNGQVFEHRVDMQPKLQASDS
jgi:hypothetical protein